MNIINISGINEIDLTLSGSTTISTSGGTTSIVNVNDGPNVPVARVSSNYPIGVHDFQVEATTIGLTVTLPTAVGVSGKMYSIKNTSAGALTVNTTSSQLIDGALTQTLAQWDNLMLISNGIGWLII
jgi:hypothetical protein